MLSVPPLSFSGAIPSVRRVNRDLLSRAINRWVARGRPAFREMAGTPCYRSSVELLPARMTPSTPQMGVATDSYFPLRLRQVSALPVDFADVHRAPPTELVLDLANLPRQRVPWGRRATFPGVVSNGDTVGSVFIGVVFETPDTFLQEMLVTKGDIHAASCHIRPASITTLLDTSLHQLDIPVDFCTCDA